jgi:DNA-binding transcriptional MerR regulator
MTEEMRLDELAAAAGVASTTVRLYQQRGLLPGPRLVGRTGWWSQDHLERLRLIARLQDQGFSLAGIGQLIEAAERGGDLGDLVGIQAQIDGILRGPEPEVLDPVELMARFPTDSVGPAEMARAVELGLVEGTDDGRLRVPDRRFLEVGPALIDLGMPTARVLDEWEHLSGVADGLARRFVTIFETDVLGEGWRDRIDPDLAAQAAEALPRLIALAHQVVDAALDAALAREVEARLDDLRDPKGGSPDTARRPG